MSDGLPGDGVAPAGGASVLTGELGVECECGNRLANGAYGGWWCPVHNHVTPHRYAVDAARELYGKYLSAANELYALKKSLAQTPNVELTGAKPVGKASGSARG